MTKKTFKKSHCHYDGNGNDNGNDVCYDDDIGCNRWKCKRKKFKCMVKHILMKL